MSYVGKYFQATNTGMMIVQNLVGTRGIITKIHDDKSPILFEAITTNGQKILLEGQDFVEKGPVESRNVEFLLAENAILKERIKEISPKA